LVRHGQEYEQAGFKSITSYLDRKQISRLIFFWIILSSLFIGSYPLFQIELPLILAALLIIINISAIFFFYHILFKSKSQKQADLAFIVTNIFLSILLLVFILNALLFQS